MLCHVNALITANDLKELLAKQDQEENQRLSDDLFNVNSFDFIKRDKSYLNAQKYSLSVSLFVNILLELKVI